METELIKKIEKAVEARVYSECGTFKTSDIAADIGVQSKEVRNCVVRHKTSYESIVRNQLSRFCHFKIMTGFTDSAIAESLGIGRWQLRRRAGKWFGKPLDEYRAEMLKD